MDSLSTQVPHSKRNGSCAFLVLSACFGKVVSYALVKSGVNFLGAPEEERASSSWSCVCGSAAGVAAKLIVVCVWMLNGDTSTLTRSLFCSYFCIEIRFGRKASVKVERYDNDTNNTNTSVHVVGRCRLLLLLLLLLK